MSRAARKAVLQEEVSLLKAVLHQLDIPYRETGRIRTPGGLCQVEGKTLCILKADLALDRKHEVLREALRSLDLAGVFLKPRVRQILGIEDAAPAGAENATA